MILCQETLWGACSGGECAQSFPCSSLNWLSWRCTTLMFSLCLDVSRWLRVRPGYSQHATPWQHITDLQLSRLVLFLLDTSAGTWKHLKVLIEEVRIGNVAKEGGEADKKALTELAGQFWQSKPSKLKWALWWREHLIESISIRDAREPESILLWFSQTKIARHSGSKFLQENNSWSTHCY